MSDYQLPPPQPDKPSAWKMLAKVLLILFGVIVLGVIVLAGFVFAACSGMCTS